MGRLIGGVHRALTATSVYGHGTTVASRMWGTAYTKACQRWGAELVSLRLHGQPATINFANPYPVTSRIFANYNAPQVELVEATASALGRQVDVVDVGAAVGDTALLLLARAPSLRTLVCVEGEERHAQLLRTNLSDARVTIHQALLSDSPNEIASLVRHHEGTASAQGAGSAQATTLDRLLNAMSPDVLKIDTDGFDGTILAGAKAVLAGRPSVLFEWHPGLTRDVGADPCGSFEVLREAGYTRWVWFTKYGQFSHFGDEHLREYLRLYDTTTTLPDWHYDVVALHRDSPVDEVAVADLRHWGASGWT